MGKEKRIASLFACWLLGVASVFLFFLCLVYFDERHSTNKVASTDGVEYDTVDVLAVDIGKCFGRRYEVKGDTFLVVTKNRKEMDSLIHVFDSVRLQQHIDSIVDQVHRSRPY